MDSSSISSQISLREILRVFSGCCFDGQPFVCWWHVLLFFFSFVLAELEFVQIIIIIVVITVMVVVIICLLNHYKLSTRSFINRQSQSRRQEETLQTVSVNPCTKLLFLVLCGPAAKPPKELWYRQLLEKLLMLPLILSVVRSFAKGVFVSRKQFWNANLRYAVLLFLDPAVFYVAYINFAFGGLDVTVFAAAVIWEGSVEGEWIEISWGAKIWNTHCYDFPSIVWYPGVLLLLLFCEAAMAVYWIKTTVPVRAQQNVMFVSLKWQE